MIFTSPYADIEIPAIALTDFVLEHSAEYGDKPALIDGATGRAVDIGVLDELVRREVVLPFDHRNLNREVAAFASGVPVLVPTSENLGLEICRRLKRNWKQVFPGEWPKLEKIRIGETPRNIFEVGADEID